jgi:nitroreductase
MINPIIEAITRRRSIRKYLDKPVSREIIDTLLNTAVMSPSAMNRQPWRFIVIENRQRIRELSEKVKKQMNLLGYAHRLAEIIQSKNDTIFHGAPLLIIITAEKDDKWSRINCGIIAQSMFLAAYSLGLGSCYIGFANTLNNDSTTLKELKVPENHEIIAALIFGYPAETKEQPKRGPRVINWIG